MRRLLAILALWPALAWGAIAEVNSWFAGGATSGNTAAIGPQTLTSGNILLVCIAAKPTNLTVSTVTDNGASGGNTYLTAGAGSVSTSNYRTECFYSKLTNSGSLTTTITMSGTVTDLIVSSLQYSGVAGTYPFDIAASNGGTGTSASVTFTPSGSGETAVAFAVVPTGNNVTWDGNYTNRDSGHAGGNADMYGADRIGSPSGSQSATATVSSGAWQIVALVISATDINNNALPPTASPTPATYPAPQTVTLSCASPSPTIRYTTDGSTPTGASATYSAPFSTGGWPGMNVQAICQSSGLTDSPVVGFYYPIGSATSARRGLR
jgi:hypothetical protein